MNIPGGSVADLTSAPNFPDRPDRVGYIAKFETEDNVAEQFGRRISGWIVPKETAEYVFYLCSDDGGKLSISSDASPAKLQEVAIENGWANHRAWKGLKPESISEPIPLKAGERYFVEALHKEGSGQDRFAVTWSKVGEPAPEDGDEPIGGEFLSYGVE